jgi:nucleotide-binding universal stress UspA family protein
VPPALALLDRLSGQLHLVLAHLGGGAGEIGWLQPEVRHDVCAGLRLIGVRHWQVSRAAWSALTAPPCRWSSCNPARKNGNSPVTPPPRSAGSANLADHERETAVDSFEIVVGVDGSPQADTAVRWAATRAQHTGARLRLLHTQVVPVPAPAMPLAAPAPYTADPQDYAAAGEAVLTAAATVAHNQASGIDVTTDLRVGGAAPVLIDASAEADLIVVGSRGLGGFAGLLLGSVSAQVSGHARCPVVVVHGQPSAAGPVVVGVDGSEPAAKALTFAFGEARRFGTGVIAVHAWSLPLPAGPAEAAAAARATGDDPARYRQAARQVLTDAVADCRRQHPDVPVDERLVEHSAAGALLEAAAEPAMIVVGSRGHGGFIGLLLGSTSHSVLHHATCPVAVVHAGQATQPGRGPS